MRYMLLIYTNEEAAERRTPEEYARLRDIHLGLQAEATAKGILHGTAPLQPTRTATTVRMNGGKAMVHDGPFAETREQLAGYYVLECQDLDEAIAWAARVPTLSDGGEGCVEIRPLR